jgi:hypothetical protein
MLESPFDIIAEFCMFLKDDLKSIKIPFISWIEEFAAYSNTQLFVFSWNWLYSTVLI